MQAQGGSGWYISAVVTLKQTRSYIPDNSAQLSHHKVITSQSALPSKSASGRDYIEKSCLVAEN